MVDGIELQRAGKGDRLENRDKKIDTAYERERESISSLISFPYL